MPSWIVQNQFFILLTLVAAGFGISGWLLFDLKKKVRILFGVGKREGDFPRDFARRVARSEAKLEEFEPRLRLVEKISRTSIQKVGFLRFNPFGDTGGDQSFILALLDRENNGVLVTSLYSREGTRLYAKEVAKGKTKQQLSQEETKVLEEAINKISKP